MDKIRIVLFTIFEYHHFNFMIFFRKTPSFNCPVFLVVLLLLGFFSASGQNYQIEKNLTIEDGLPSNETYASYFDDLGDLWILTDKGLVRYDGLISLVLTEEDGLPDNAVFKHYLDHANRHWFTTKRGLFYMLGDSIIIPKFNDQLMKHVKFETINSIYVDSEDSIYISLANISSGYFKSSIQSKTCTFNFTGLNFEERLIIKEINSKVSIRTYFTVQSAHQTVASGISISRRLDTLFEKSSNLNYLMDNELNNTRKFCTLSNSENKLIRFSEYKTLWSVNESGKLSNPISFNAEIIYLTEKDGVIYVGLRKDGVYQIDFKNNILSHSLIGYSVAHINLDLDDAIWYSTLNRGVLKINRNFTKAFQLPVNLNFSNCTKPIWFDGSNLQVIEENVLFNYNYNKEINKLEFKNQKKLIFDGNYKYHRMTWFNKDSLLLGKMVINSKKNTYHTRYSDLILKLIILDSNENGIIYRSSGVLLEKGNDTTFNSEVKTPGYSFFDILKWNEDSLILSSKEGLLLLSQNELEQFSSQPRKEIQQLTRWRSKLVGGSNGNGFYLIKHETLKNYSVAEGLSGSFVQKLFVRNDTLWIGTNKGLNYAYIEKSSNKIIISKNVLPVHIDNFWFTTSSLYAQSSSNFYRINTSKLIESKTPQLAFLNIVSSNKPITSNKTGSYVLPTGQNMLKVEFRLHELLNDNSQWYQYKINNLNNSWVTTSERSISFNNLPFGKYTLQMKGRSSSGQWSNVECLNFEVVPLFYQRKWFQPILYILIGLGLGGIALSFQRERSKRYALQNVMLKSSLSALKLQINPHFIFNALNSLQYLILSDEKKKSTDFVGQFSYLVRDVLDNSQQTYIALNEEIERLQTYLKLEEVRMQRGSIELEIVKEGGLKAERILIPNMILQPIVENAIWHGLMPVKTTPKIIIKVYKKGNTNCVVEIIDNGKGIDMSQLEAKQNEGSLAIKNIQERLFLFSKLEKKEFFIRFEATDPGTRVIITVPLIIINQ